MLNKKFAFIYQKIVIVKTNNVRVFPNVIIFGGMRCGTTSLFRYLSDHPSVFRSNKKELDIFYYNISGTKDFLRERYKKEFEQYKGKEDVLLEASPRYARKYKDISEKISSTIPDVKIIYLIRDPVERIKSVYKAISRSNTLAYGVSFETYVTSMINKNVNIFVDKTKALENLEELNLGNYKKIIEQLARNFGKERVFIECLENLSTQPYEVIGRVCDFIDIDSAHYLNYEFTVENPSIDAKSSLLYKLALDMNMQLEPILNHFPKIRVFLRKLHHSVNKKNVNKDDLGAIHKLNNYYENYNNDLGNYLSDEFKLNTLPSWLK